MSKAKKDAADTSDKLMKQFEARLKKMKPVKLSAFDAHRILEALKTAERSAPSDAQDSPVLARVQSMLIQHDEQSIPFMVKLAILNASGRGGDPKDLPDDTEIADLITDQAKFIVLRGLLTAIIQQENPSGQISVSQIKSSPTVADVIALVTQIIQ